jgi:hypothetical protein
MRINRAGQSQSPSSHLQDKEVGSKTPRLGSKTPIHTTLFSG